MSSAIVALLAIAGSAGAVVVNTNATGATVPYNPADQSGYYGVSLIQPSPTSSVADPRAALASANIPRVTTAGSCEDPWLAPGFSPLAIGAGNGLCAHPTPGSNWGSVLPATETFALTWDPSRLYWQGTHDYLARFLSDVAAGSGTLSSPFALTGQYGSQNGVVGNSWRYGGGCTDQGGSGVSCQFTSSPVSGPPSLPSGNEYAASGASCSRTTGNNEWAEFPDGGWGSGSNSQCITDSEIQAELKRMVPQTAMLGHLVPGYKPLVVLLTPPGVVDCLDAGANLCSVNSDAPAKFCSYHGQVTLPGGATLPYVVQPWTASWDEDPGKYPNLVNLGCDDPEFNQSPIPIPLPDTRVFAQDAGARLVSPLSQGLLAAATNPFLNGWYSFADGSEINDDGCVELGQKLDTVTVGTSSQNPYILQREFNNGGVLATDPNSPRCAPQNTLGAVFVAPSAVNVTDEVQLDGSATASTLQIAPDKYVWNFGDNSQARGPSVVHTYTAAGTYTVTLTVTDRGGNTSTYAQNLTVLTADGKPAPAPATSAGSGSGGGSSTGGGPVAPFQVHLVLLPQSLRTMLRSGVALQVNSNQRASGLVTVSISRQAARRAGIAVGSSATVAVGRGTVTQVTNGRAVLRLHLSSKVAAKLRRLRHVTVTVHLSLVPAVGRRLSIVIAGRY